MATGTSRGTGSEENPPAGLGITTRYSHLDEALVSKGQRVKSGSLIGRSGNTGATTGPHLHFEIRARGKAVNPVTYLRRF